MFETLRSMCPDWPVAQSIKTSGSSKERPGETEVFYWDQPVI